MPDGNAPPPEFLARYNVRTGGIHLGTTGPRGGCIPRALREELQRPPYNGLRSKGGCALYFQPPHARHRGSLDPLEVLWELRRRGLSLTVVTYARSPAP